MRHGLLIPFKRPILDAAAIKSGEFAGELLMRAACHADAGLRAEYHADTGTLALSCHACDRLVAAIVVAP